MEASGIDCEHGGEILFRYSRPFQANVLRCSRPFDRYHSFRYRPSTVIIPRFFRPSTVQQTIRRTDYHASPTKHVALHKRTIVVTNKPRSCAKFPGGMGFRSPADRRPRAATDRRRHEQEVKAISIAWPSTPSRSRPPPLPRNHDQRKRSRPVPGTSRPEELLRPLSLRVTRHGPPPRPHPHRCAERGTEAE